jgi:uncharacterized protein YrrD
MLRKTSDLMGFGIHAEDGDFGKVKDLLFDDEKWVIRYLVIDTGGFLLNRKVLISPYVVQAIDWKSRVIHITLTREQVRESPDIDTNMPVSRQHELETLRYYRWPYYWGGVGLWGPFEFPNTYPGAMPDRVSLVSVDRPELTPEGQEQNPHLRSAREMRGYRILATDSEFGHVEDFVLDERSWAIRYLMIDTQNWWPSRPVLVSPQWISGVSWTEQGIHVDLSAETVKAAPRIDEDVGITREYEKRLHEHYGRPSYWSDATGEGEAEPGKGRKVS